MEVWLVLLLLVGGYLASTLNILTRVARTLLQLQYVQHKEALAMTLLVLFAAFATFFYFPLSQIAAQERREYWKHFDHAQRHRGRVSTRPPFRRSSFGPGHAVRIKELLLQHAR